MSQPTDAEVLKDIMRRHSSLHTIDKECTAAVAALVRMVPAATEHKLTDKLSAVMDALQALHRAAEAKHKVSP